MDPTIRIKLESILGPRRPTLGSRRPEPNGDNDFDRSVDIKIESLLETLDDIVIPTVRNNDTGRNRHRRCHRTSRIDQFRLKKKMRRVRKWTRDFATFLQLQAEAQNLKEPVETHTRATTPLSPYYKHDVDEPVDPQEDVGEMQKPMPEMDETATSKPSIPENNVGEEKNEDQDGSNIIISLDE